MGLGLANPAQLHLAAVDGEDLSGEKTFAGEDLGLEGGRRVVPLPGHHRFPSRLSASSDFSILSRLSVPPKKAIDWRTTGSRMSLVAWE